MAEHTIAVKHADRNRYINDEPLHEDNEYYLLKLLEDKWIVANTQNIKPLFYLTDKQITHDLSLAPAVKVSENDQGQTALGLGFVAKSMKLSMKIELITLDRTMMFDALDEIIRILDFCRKRPIPEWDFIYTVTVNRMDPRAGNYDVIIQANLERLCRPIPDAV